MVSIIRKIEVFAFNYHIIRMVKNRLKSNSFGNHNGFFVHPWGISDVVEIWRLRKCDRPDIMIGFLSIHGEYQMLVVAERS